MRIARSGIQTISPGKQDFPSIATRFLQTVTEVFGITQLSWFRFRYVLGKLCNSDAEAQALMEPLIPEDAKAKMRTLTDLQNWQAVQAEFLFANLSWQSRTAIIYLIPHEKAFPVQTKPGVAMPHITVQLEAQGIAPIDLIRFDAEAFMKNVRDNHSKEIISKLSPHLS